MKCDDEKISVDGHKVSQMPCNHIKEGYLKNVLVRVRFYGFVLKNMLTLFFSTLH